MENCVNNGIDNEVCQKKKKKITNTARNKNFKIVLTINFILRIRNMVHGK